MYKRGVGKVLAALPERVGAALDDLVEDLKDSGPEQKDWPNFKQLKGQKRQKKTERRYHCHLKKGKPTYVACWEVVGQSIEIEIYYVGAHESAPY
ncbi:MAG: cytotoxic translational repressor of toxin-antitoxin stability system [Deltaproteobacteria bacterium]|nr:MAG: cytotoxic translational repressor of toxin-antitoxin stability system [Deltaproteobacteria bacterium]